MLRIGLPRALSIYQHYPQWRTFFEDLGARIILSPPTNRAIVTAGAKSVADVTCLPIKIYGGHAAWLRDHGEVDFVFSPGIWSLEPDAFHCAKFKALPDIVRATVEHCPPLLDPHVDPQLRKITEKDAFQQMAKGLTRDKSRIERAWRHCQQVDAEFRAMLVGDQRTYTEVLAHLYPDDWETPCQRLDPASAKLTIGIVGHPYCLHDDYMNHNLIQHLTELGVSVLTSEMVSPEDAQVGIDRTTGQTLWFYEKWMSGAAGHFLYSPLVDGLMSTLAFACGPDSTMVDTITRAAHKINRPYLSLVLDEHGSSTGMMTRLEAFVDMLVRQRQRHGATMVPVYVPPVIHRFERPVIGIPTMGTSIWPLKSAFRGIGAELELGPPVSKRTITLGAKSAPEFMCTPYKQVLGNMIEMLEAGANTLIYVDGIDLCRNSSYHIMMEDALRDLNYKFRMMTFGMIFEKGIFALPAFLRQFNPDLTWPTIIREIALCLAKLRALDDLERRVHYLRPREAVSGGIDKIWKEAQTRIDLEALDQATLKRTVADVNAKLNRVPLNPDARPVKIALTGEIFAVLDPFYNLDVERELGQLGAEVHRTLMLSNWVRGQMILEALGFPHWRKIEKAARPYLRWNISGEGWVTVAETVLSAAEGFDGVVELLPFTCEPEITALNILPQVHRDHNIPVLSFIYDEQPGQAGMRTRMEAFVDLLIRRRAMRDQGVSSDSLSRHTAQGDDVCAACPVLGTCSVKPQARASCSMQNRRML